MRWHRGRMTHGTNAWLIWRLAENADRIEETATGAPYSAVTGSYARTHAEITGDGDDPTLWIDTHAECGWLSEAKATVEILVAERSVPAAPNPT